MSWEQKYNQLRVGLRAALMGLRAATGRVNLQENPRTADIFTAIRRLEDLLPEEACPRHVEPEKAEQLELPLVPRSVSEVQGL